MRTHYPNKAYWIYFLFHQSNQKGNNSTSLSSTGHIIRKQKQGTILSQTSQVSLTLTRKLIETSQEHKLNNQNRCICNKQKRHERIQVNYSEIDLVTNKSSTGHGTRHPTTSNNLKSLHPWIPRGGKTHVAARSQPSSLRPPPPQLHANPPARPMSVQWHRKTSHLLRRRPPRRTSSCSSPRRHHSYPAHRRLLLWPLSLPLSLSLSLSLSPARVRGGAGAAAVAKAQRV
jgi:hypothetical protein